MTRTIRECVSIAATAISMTVRWVDDRSTLRHLEAVQARACARVTGPTVEECYCPVAEAERIVREAWIEEFKSSLGEWWEYE